MWNNYSQNETTLTVFLNANNKDASTSNLVPLTFKFRNYWT